MSPLPNSPLPLLLPSLPFQHRVKLITAYLLMLRTLGKKGGRKKCCHRNIDRASHPQHWGKAVRPQPCAAGGLLGSRGELRFGGPCSALPPHAKLSTTCIPANPKSYPSHTHTPCSVCPPVCLSIRPPTPLTHGPLSPLPAAPPALLRRMLCLLDGCFNAPLGGRFL